MEQERVCTHVANPKPPTQPGKGILASTLTGLVYRMRPVDGVLCVDGVELWKFLVEHGLALQSTFFLDNTMAEIDLEDFKCGIFALISGWYRRGAEAELQDGEEVSETLALSVL